MAIVYQKPKALSDDVLHYCPGCTHGIIPSPEEVYAKIMEAASKGGAE